MAEMSIDNLTTPFNPSVWHDETETAIKAAAQPKVESKEIVAPQAPEAAGMVSLTEALKASVETTK